MGKIQSITIEGASGAEYDFNIYSADMPFNPVKAVYIIANREESEDEVKYDMLYLGETDNLPERLADHHFRNLWIENGWNVIWVYQEHGHVERVQAVADLIAIFNPRIIE